MKKFFTFLLIVIISIFIAAIYGILHDQLTYSISPEYYTKFKFLQFGLAEEGVEVQNPRLMAAVTGVIASWWVGAIVGFVLSCAGLLLKTWQEMLKITLKAILLNILMVFILGCIGYCYAYLFLPNHWEDNLILWGVPYETIDVANFVRVGTLHNSSYLGGLIGMIFGIVYIIKAKKKITVK